MNYVETIIASLTGNYVTTTSAAGDSHYYTVRTAAGRTVAIRYSNHVQPEGGSFRHFDGLGDFRDDFFGVNVVGRESGATAKVRAAITAALAAADADEDFSVELVFGPAAAKMRRDAEFRAIERAAAAAAYDRDRAANRAVYEALSAADRAVVDAAAAAYDAIKSDALPKKSDRRKAIHRDILRRFNLKISQL